jgi:hypothetical protein
MPEREKTDQGRATERKGERRMERKKEGRNEGRKERGHGGSYGSERIEMKG